MKIYTDIQQNTDEWFAIRLGKLTASEAQAIASDGKGLDTLCFKLAAEKLSGKSSESYTNEDMERGKELEALARNAYEIETGIVAKQVGFVELTEFVGCSPDGLINDDGLLEIKCPNDANFVRFMYEGKIDTKYIWQVQMQLFVTERVWVDFVIFNANFPKSIIITRIERDEEKIEKLQGGLFSGEEMIKNILSKV
jgi:putative phage-type endonuclease